MRGLGAASWVLVAAYVLAVAASAQAELRITDLDIFLNDYEVTVHVVLLGAIPDGFHEGIESGMPAHVRFTVELWRYNRLWRDQLLVTKAVERQLTYNVVTKEYKVTFVQGEARPPYTSREVREAQRVLSEVRGLKLTPATALDPTGVVYIRVRAEAALAGENTFVARMAGTAEQTFRQSDYYTLTRVQ